MLQIRNEMGLCSEMPQLVIVDEIGKPYMSNRESMRIMKELRKLAEATDATVLILSNTSRLADERPDHMPVPSDFPVPDYMADVMIRMYREGYYMEGHVEKYDPTHLIYDDANTLMIQDLCLDYVPGSGFFAGNGTLLIS